MPKSSRFRQADVRRAIAALRAAGAQPVRLEVAPDGVFTLHLGDTSDDHPSDALEKWLAQNAYPSQRRA